ncbi:MAG: SIMPL domain-containing protein [Tenuifilum sp.]|uniref:SIMPL domain-containing protein n=1 Tax=Tenuifilum sp. TaxID=2760880 RepID=UPI001B6728BC|nr:SIMPL domain-containing protein [Bacteroidales bacterium]HOK62195.1 SIMPL domain-containing protein [Tenuifilum sp.]MBP9029741.1 SIMPL domain-containing protein [Bacteroidales bacterium]HOK87037.1 SIMPL domain-containing protein [Tenuifilum sp.]HON71649.1 SIMPL domain-containing protein [Tenuifilum sp.]
MKKSDLAIISIGVVIAFGLCGYLIGQSIENFRNGDRTILVKGFAEREVKADLAVWSISCRAASNDLVEGAKRIEQDQKKIIDFLVDKGIGKEEIISREIRVNDRLANEYGGYDNVNFRYVIVKVLQVRSTNVDRVQEVSRLTDELVRAGVVISQNDYSNNLQYYFTKLNDIKPEMLTEATQNAREAAISFASESGVKLGKLKRASQGLFTIVDRDQSLSGGDSFASGNSDIVKRVRVVISVEYSIK